MDIGLGQAGLGRDHGGGGAREARLGEDLLGGGEDAGLAVEPPPPAPGLRGGGGCRRFWRRLPLHPIPRAQGEVDRLVRLSLASAASPRPARPAGQRTGQPMIKPSAELADPPGPDIAAGRLSPAEYRANFGDIEAPLDAKRALVDSSRCYFCHDAPCVEACPTGIDIPGFIRKIWTGNVAGAAVTILEQNIFGGACARVCPTEILCERACVRNASEEKPVNIGALQRYATDRLFVACAHRLALLGHEAVVCEAREKLGCRNGYGVAAYKVPDDFAQREVDFILR